MKRLGILAAIAVAMLGTAANATEYVVNGSFDIDTYDANFGWNMWYETPYPGSVGPNSNIWEIVDEKTLEAITKPYRDAEKARGDLYQKLKGVIEACTTLKKLKELLPEFEAYFPTEAEPTKNLPAVANLVTDMMQMGWPKDKRKLAKKGGV